MWQLRTWERMCGAVLFVTMINTKLLLFMSHYLHEYCFYGLKAKRFLFTEGRKGVAGNWLKRLKTGTSTPPPKRAHDMDSKVT